MLGSSRRPGEASQRFSTRMEPRTPPNSSRWRRSASSKNRYRCSADTRRSTKCCGTTTAKIPLSGSPGQRPHHARHSPDEVVLGIGGVSMDLRLVEGDLLDQDVEVIVNAWNRNLIPWWLLLPQGVSGAIKRRGGKEPFRELGRMGVIPLGGAVVTGAGRLPFK